MGLMAVEKPQSFEKDLPFKHHEDVLEGETGGRSIRQQEEKDIRHVINKLLLRTRRGRRCRESDPGRGFGKGSWVVFWVDVRHRAPYPVTSI